MFAEEQNQAFKRSSDRLYCLYISLATQRRAKESLCASPAAGEPSFPQLPLHFSEAMYTLAQQEFMHLESYCEKVTEQQSTMVVHLGSCGHSLVLSSPALSLALTEAPGITWDHYSIPHYCHTLQRSQFFYKWVDDNTNENY